MLKVKVPRDVIITNAETVFREFNRDLRDPRQHGIPYDWRDSVPSYGQRPRRPLLF